MPKRIPTCTVIVQREGKNFKPAIGKPFDFTADEIEEINNVMPSALRKPVNEEAAPESKPPAAPQGKQPQGGKPQADKGGKQPTKTDAGDGDL